MRQGPFPSLWEGLGEGLLGRDCKPSPQPSPKGRGSKKQNTRGPQPQMIKLRLPVGGPPHIRRHSRVS